MDQERSETYPATQLSVLLVLQPMQWLPQLRSAAQGTKSAQQQGISMPQEAQQRRSQCRCRHPRNFFFFGLLVGWAFRLLGLFFLAIFWGPGFTGTLRAAEGLKEGTGRGASDMGDTAEVAGWAYRCRKRWLSMWQSAKVKPIPVPKWHPQLNHLLGICEGLCNTPCIRLIKIGIVAQNCGETLGNNSKLRK